VYGFLRLDVYILVRDQENELLPGGDVNDISRLYAIRAYQQYDGVQSQMDASKWML